jgi:hypothetical protein
LTRSPGANTAHRGGSPERPMTVLSYLAPAAAVLAVTWAAVRLARSAIGSSPSLAAITAVVIFSLIAITPLCGLMFDCGCDWPWHGLHRHCNVFDAHTELKCPWCDSRVAGALSMFAVFGASSFVAYRAAEVTASANARFTIGVLAGALTFHLSSLATAMLAALATGYPLPFAS